MKTRKFTLIEIIIGFVLLSIVAVSIGVFINNMLQAVRQPEAIIASSMNFKKSCASIRSDFEANFHSDIDNFRIKVGTGTQNNSYGNYTVISNGYVVFSDNTGTYSESGTGTATDYLKVKLKSATTPEQATLIFHAN